MIASTPGPVSRAIAEWRERRKIKCLTFEDRKAAAISSSARSDLADLFSGELPDPKSNVISFKDHPVVKALKLAGGTVESNRQLARLQGISDGESTKRVREVEHLLTIERNGKNKLISLRA